MLKRRSGVYPFFNVWRDDGQKRRGKVRQPPAVFGRIPTWKTNKTGVNGLVVTARETMAIVSRAFFSPFLANQLSQHLLSRNRGIVYQNRTRQVEPSLFHEPFSISTFICLSPSVVLILKSSFRFPAPCYVSRRGAEKLREQSNSHTVPHSSSPFENPILQMRQQMGLSFSPVLGEFVTEDVAVGVLTWPG